MSIEEVKQRYEKGWLRIPGVTTVGIGLNKDGEKVIKVGVDQVQLLKSALIPDYADGYAVEKVLTGRIKAEN